MVGHRHPALLSAAVQTRKKRWARDGKDGKKREACVESQDMVKCAKCPMDVQETWALGVLIDLGIWSRSHIL